MTLDEIERRTGVTAPTRPDEDEARAYRAKAYRSYRPDVARRDEWGTAAQATEPPGDDASEL